MAQRAVSLLHQGEGRTSEDLEGDKPPQTKTFRVTGFLKSASRSCQFVFIEHRMIMLLEGSLMGFLCIKAELY